MRGLWVKNVWVSGLICFLPLVTSNFHPLTSPDVDIKAGFFPDSGYMVSGADRNENFLPSFSERGPTAATLGNFWKPQSTNNVLGSRADLLAARLRRLVNRLSHTKSSWSRPVTRPEVHIPRPGYLTMFTGSKDLKL